MFKEAYSNWSICYCAPLGLGSSPFIPPEDTRPASTMPGDDYSKQFKRELLNYSHLESNIKMLNDVYFFVHFEMSPKLVCLRKLSSGPWYFLKSIPLSFPGQRAGIN